MKKYLWIVIFFFQAIAMMLHAQKKTYSQKWMSNPFDNNIFIENKGQFDGALPNNERILYK
ncbi:MAG: hypothetical protein ACLQQ4_13065 [Bacteroidia bacterium]